MTDDVQDPNDVMLQGLWRTRDMRRALGLTAGDQADVMFQTSHGGTEALRAFLEEWPRNFGYGHAQETGRTMRRAMRTDAVP